MIIDPSKIKMEDVIRVNALAKWIAMDAVAQRNEIVLEQIAQKLNETFNVKEVRP